MSQQGTPDRNTQIQLATAELAELKRRLGIMEHANQLLKESVNWAEKGDGEDPWLAVARSLACLAQSQILLHTLNLADVQNKIAAFEQFLKQIQSPILQVNLVPPSGLTRQGR